MCSKGVVFLSSAFEHIVENANALALLFVPFLEDVRTHGTCFRVTFGTPFSMYALTNFCIPPVRGVAFAA